MTDRSKYKVLLYSFGTVLLWASSFPLTKVALVHFSAFSVGLLRYLFASALLLVIVSVKRIPFPAARDIPKFFLAGASGFALYMVAFNMGSMTLTSATASILIATGPILTAILARILFKEKLLLVGWISVAIEFLGILILTLWNGAFSVNIGILWMLLAALCISVYNLCQRSFTAKYTALQTSAYSIFAGTILLLVFLPQTIPALQTASLQDLLTVAYLGIFPGAVGYMWWTKALSISEKTSDVTNFMFVTPFLAALFGFLIHRETPTVSILVGGVVILLGLFLFQFSRRKK